MSSFHPLNFSRRENRSSNFNNIDWELWCDSTTTITAAPTRMMARQLSMLLLHSNLLKASLYRLSQEVPLPLNSYYDILPPQPRKPAFRLANVMTNFILASCSVLQISEKNTNELQIHYQCNILSGSSTKFVCQIFIKTLNIFHWNFYEVLFS